MVKRNRLAPPVLDRPGSGSNGTPAYRGKKRKNSPANDRRREDRKRKGITEEGGSTAAHPQGVGKRRQTKQPGSGYTLREITRRAEAGYKCAGRSAKKLGLKYPSNVCITKLYEHKGIPIQVGGPHHFVEIPPHTGVFTCRYCLLSKWQPNSMIIAHRFSNRINKLGLQEAYLAEVDCHPSARQLLVRLKKEKEKRENGEQG